MALTATLHTFDVALSNMDRGVYEQLAIKAARHPSESEDFLLTRVIAYCLEYTEGIAFSKGGISDPDDPAITVKDLTGAWRSWIEVGAPDAARLHLASKASPRVAVYFHRDPRVVLANYAGQRIHRADAIDAFVMDRGLLTALAERLDRRNSWSLSVTEGHLYLETGGTTLEGTIERVGIPQ
jgi:uncharacterized protein YaeQ